MCGDNRSFKEILSILRHHILSSPTRLTIALILLEKGEIVFKDLVEALGVTPGSLWSHLTRMKEEGIITIRYRISMRGPRLVISLTDEGVIELKNYIKILDQLIDRDKVKTDE